MQTQKGIKRAVVICWKNRDGYPIELFSSLKNLCLSYPQYNYNTLSNYLSKDKIAYENNEVKIERKIVYSKPITSIHQRNIASVVKKRPLKDTDEKQHDLDYWLQQSLVSRLSAVTFIVAQSLKKDQRIDKTIVYKKERKL